MKLNFYDRFCSFFVNAQKSYPKSFVAFDETTGKVFVHDEDNAKFNEKLKSFKETRPEMKLVIIYPENKDIPTIFKRAQGHMIGHALEAA